MTETPKPKPLPVAFQQIVGRVRAKMKGTAGAEEKISAFVRQCKKIRNAMPGLVTWRDIEAGVRKLVKKEV